MNLAASLCRLLDIAPPASSKRLFNIHPFRLRPPEEIGEVFDTGGGKAAPPLADIPTAKIDVWVFAQIGFIGASAFAVLCYLVYHFENIRLLPALIVVGAFAVPMSCLIFFWEINAPRNIGLFTLLFMVLAAGVLGMASSLFLFDYTQLGKTWLHASSAGLIEEPGKLAAVVVLAGRRRKYPWMLNGLLFGAAAGTGFAAFESAGYAFEILARSNSLEAAIANTVLRGVLAPFGHVIWTAASAAALWKAMEGREFSAKALSDGRFLKVFAAVAGLHMLWNSPVSLFSVISLGGTVLVDGKEILAGWLGWVVVLGLAREGFEEIRQAQRRSPKPASACLILEGSNFRDAFELRKPRTTLGRDAANDIVLGHPSISRRHAHVTRAGEDFVLADLGSAHGTRVNGEAVGSRRLRHGDRIDLCGIELRFEQTAPPR